MEIKWNKYNHSDQATWPDFEREYYLVAVKGNTVPKILKWVGTGFDTDGYDFDNSSIDYYAELLDVPEYVPDAEAELLSRGYVPIDDEEDVVMLWVHEECNETAEVNPSFYQNNGTPLCCCGEDMKHYWTYVRPRIKEPKVSNGLGIVNVIVMRSGLLDTMSSFPDNAEGNKRAEEMFVRWIEHLKSIRITSEIEAALEEGYFCYNNRDIFLTHSVIGAPDENTDTPE